MTTPGLPKRIRLRRGPGWTLPENAVIVTRPTKWGNPFRVGEPYNNYPAAQNHLQAVELFRRLVMDSAEYRLMARMELAGRDLACWCPLADPAGGPVSCHADVLLEVANPELWVVSFGRPGW